LELKINLFLYVLLKIKLKLFFGNLKFLFLICLVNMSFAIFGVKIKEVSSF